MRSSSAMQLHLYSYGHALRRPARRSADVLLPPADDRRVYLILTRDLRQWSAGLDLTYDLQLEVRGEVTPFKSQGRCLL
jgi:hypothetical protein